MANLTTTFTSWSALENLIAAGDVYADSSAYDAELANLENLTYELFSYPSTAFSGSDSYAYASGYYRNVELWGGGFSTDNWLITQARIDNTSNASSLLLQGSVRFDAYGNPYGSLTYLSYLHGGFGQWERGSVPLQGGIATLTSWGATLPTALGSLTYEHKGLSSTNLTTGFTTETYTATTVMDGSGHRADLTGFSLTLTDTDASTVSFLHTILAGNDSITGAAGSQELRGFSGNDTLDGLSGADSMLGGAGNDTFIVDDAGDTVVELANEGLDTVKSTVSWSLATTPEIENIVLTGAANAQATGNAAANVLTGNAGNNRLDGGLGNDTMIGGLGNDTFVVDNPGDVVTEAVGGGTDVIESSISLSLVPTPNIENLTLTGAAANGTGNALNNILTGNAQANTLDGNVGNDTLDGSTGADTMLGGAGDDTYTMDDLGDVITENAGEGTDTLIITLQNFGAPIILTAPANIETILFAPGSVGVVLATSGSSVITGSAGIDSVAFTGGGTYTLPTGIENLQLTQNTGNIGGTGGAENNLLEGNNGANILDGGAGNDTLKGYAGEDILLGGSGNDRLDGGKGADRMEGGTGDDTYTVDNANDQIIEAAASGTDTVRSWLKNTTLGDNLENLILEGAAKANGIGNDLANSLTGNVKANLLTGGAGADTFVFNTALGPMNVDTITDFTTGSDKIALDHTIFGTLSGGWFHSVTSLAQTDADDHILYDQSTGALYYDADASGVGAAVRFAMVSGIPALLATDIQII